jgi:hypothetical protein
MDNGEGRAVKSANGAPWHSRASVEPSAASVFTLLWDALADLLGTAAAAILLRRAAQRAAPRNPELNELVIVRDNLDYRYTLPSAWREGTAVKPRGLLHLIGELMPLLVDLTGPVAARHLVQIPELREWGIVTSPEEGP